MNTPYPAAFSERRQAVEWLASQSNDPRRVRREWAQDRPALVRAAGPRFDTIRLPAAIIHRTAGTTDRDKIEATLAERGITTAVIIDRPRRNHYILVLPGTHKMWNLHGIECLPPTSRIALPAPHRAEPPGTFWLLTPPGDATALCDHRDVLRLIKGGQTGE
ncbi:hypothetical protein I5Q34_31005 [Streptomyces sp. AV19]|uniref:hypothetical protein n=1 Tax=Streptomyces sp. AV19 TaxID=2793068 RepID=UPI0018FE1CA2|nr:hypothetical protein [Streptomyces sp. AV19]MBH1938638.1 hypothetical protein [Streptomyces sp. AV19]MDG4535350.1 hypothetical protein [Streptomyces sp. AV19]